MTEFGDELDFGTVPEADKALAAEALQAIKAGEMEEAASKLSQLRSKRPNDLKVLHNCLIASSGDSPTLLTELEELANSPSFDEVECCVLLLNLALLHFRQQRYHQTQELLERLMLLVEPLGEALYRDTLFLYMETCLMLNYPEKVPKLIAILENLLFGRAGTPRSGTSSPQENREQSEANAEWKPIVNRYRVRCLLALRSLKACKREVKNLNGEDKDRDDEESFVLSAFVRAQLEQQRDSGKKAIKILNTLQGKSVMERRHLATIYYNNMAAIHFKAGKTSLATMYSRHAVEEYERQLKHGQNHQIRLFFHLLYNQAVCKMFCGAARSAFEDLMGCAQLIGNNPHVWMRLAECCLLVHSEETNKKRATARVQVGEGVHRRILLKTRQPDPSELAGEKRMQPSLDVSVRSLKICLAAIADFESLTAMEVLGDNAPCVSALTELRRLNNSALCALAYASLCLADFGAAQEACEVLLIQEGLTPAQRALAHLYCAEALLMQDQLSEAVDHLNLDNVEDLASLEAKSNDATQWGPYREMAWVPSTKERSEMLFQYNLAVAFVFREELQKAEQALWPLLDAAEKNGSPPEDHVLSLALYLNLQQGRLEEAKQLTCKYLPIESACN